MSGEKTQIGIEINVAANGVSDVENNLKKISTALSSSESSAKSFKESMASLKTTGLDNIAISTTGADKAKKDIQGVTRAINAATRAPAGILKKLNLGNLGKTLDTNTESLSKFSKVLNELSQSSFFSGITTNIKKLELALGDNGAFLKSFERISGYFEQLGKISLPENLAQSIESITGGEREVQLKVFVSTSGVEESLENIGRVSTAIGDASLKISNLTRSLNELGTVKNALANLASTLGRIERNSDNAGSALRELNKDLVGSQNAGAQIDSEAKSIEGVGTQANTAAILLERMGQKASRSAKEATEEIGFLGKQLHLIRSYVEGIIAYKFLGLMSEEIGKSAEQANKLQDAFVRIQLSGNKISQTNFSNIVTSQSEKFGVAPSEESEALLKAYQFGAKSAAEAQSDLNAANNIAVITNQKVSDSLSSLLEIYNVYKDTGVSVANVSDLLAKSTLTSSANFDDYNKVLSEIVPVAKQAGISLKEVVASFATLASTGNLTNNQIYSLPTFFSSLISPTEQQVDAMKSLGIETAEVGIKTKGWGGYLKEILDKTKGNKTLIAEILGDAPGKTAEATVFFDLVNNFMQTYKQNLDAMNNANGSAAEAANKLLETNSKVFLTFGQSFVNLGSNITSVVETAIIPAIEALTKLVNAANEPILSKLSSINSPTSNAQSKDQSEINSVNSSLRAQSFLLAPFSYSFSNFLQSNSFLNALKAEFKGSVADNNYSPIGIADTLKNVISQTWKDPEFTNFASSIKTAADDFKSGKKYDPKITINTIVNADVPIKKSETIQPSSIKPNAAPITKGNAVLPAASTVQLDQAEDQNAQNLLKSLKQQSATFGQTADAVMRYRTSLGDLAGAQQQVKDQLIKQSEILEYQQAFQSLSDSFVQSFTSFAEGSESAKEAFRSFAASTLQMLTELIIKMYVFKAVDSFLNVTPGGTAGSAAAGSVTSSAVASGTSGFFSQSAPSALSSLSALPNNASRLASLSAKNSSIYGGNQIVINSPVTVHAPGASANDADKIAKQTSDHLTKNVRSLIQQEIVRQSKPGGLLKSR